MKDFMIRTGKKIFVMACLACMLFLVPQASSAQCAMCRVTVENNVSSGESSIGAGLNKGILFLLVTPYIAFCVIAFFWYKNSRKDYERRFKVAGYSRGKMSSL
jgi:hypothetical protein